MSPSLPISLLVIALLAPPTLSRTEAHAGTLMTRQLRAPRVKQALRAHAVEVREAFKEAEAAWPPRALMLRAFKRRQSRPLPAEDKRTENKLGFGI